MGNKKRLTVRHFDVGGFGPFTPEPMIRFTSHLHHVFTRVKTEHIIVLLPASIILLHTHKENT